MIKNFEEIKEQLRELSEIVNSFTSEAVQLRIVELVFGEQINSDEALPENEEEIPELSAPAKKRKLKRKSNRSEATSNTVKKKPAASGSGPVSTLAKLAEGDFFNTPQSMKSIIEHCEVNLARKIKQTDISGKLARMVREQILKRAKNADGQYEYSKA